MDKQSIAAEMAEAEAKFKSYQDDIKTKKDQIATIEQDIAADTENSLKLAGRYGLLEELLAKLNEPEVLETQDGDPIITNKRGKK